MDAGSSVNRSQPEMRKTAGGGGGDGGGDRFFILLRFVHLLFLHIYNVLAK
jgi:hypothetical protein